MNTTNEWAQEQFGSAWFGDPRLTRRAVRIAEQMARRPGDSLPKQMQDWAEQKASYRFMGNQAVSHEALCKAHWEQTRAQARQSGQTVLMVQDITELDYTAHEGTQGLGPIGDHRGRGLLLHNTLAISVGERRVIGLAYQQVWVREEVSHKQQETRAQRLKRQDRQSTRWGAAVEAIGKVPAGVRWVYVADREADIFDFFEQIQRQGADLCIRIVQNRRLADWTPEESHYLTDELREQPEMGVHEVQVPERPGQPARQARLSLSWQEVEIRSPRRQPGPSREMQLWALRAWEVAPPEGVEGLEWLLLTSVAIEQLSDGIERLEWYTSRWIVEEYHSCMKTGCQIERSQLREGAALQRLLGFVAILAVRLLQLRDLARSQGERPAIEVIDPILVQIIAQREKLDPQTMKVRAFFYAVAKVGGFPGRRSDGEPGWKRLWHGWLRLLDWAEGFHLASHLPP